MSVSPGSRPDRFSTPKLLATHPRGFPTIHLSKSGSLFAGHFSVTAGAFIYYAADTCVFTTSFFFSPSRPVGLDWGGGY